VGSDTIKVGYSGDGNFQMSSATLPYQVNMAATTTAVAAVPTSPSSYNQDIKFTATVTGAFGGSPTGTVNFTADGTPIPNCSGLPLTSLKNGTGKQGSPRKGSPQGNGSAVTCDVPTGLPVGQHNIQVTYNGDSNFSGGNGAIPYTVVKANTTIAAVISPTPTSVLGQQVVITATVTGAFGGSATGTVSFSYGTSVPIPDCTNPAPVANNQATCATRMLPFGQQTASAMYNGDGNFNSSLPGTAPQTVQDFVIATQPNSATVIQSYSNTNEPFYAQALATTLMPRGAFGYNGTVNLTCAVTGLTCSVLNDCSTSNANICISPASFLMGSGNATIAVSTAANTPLGTYMVTITGQDMADGGMPNVTVLSVTVVNNSTTVTVVPGFTGTTIANFVGTQNVTLTAFACTEITGTGLPAGGSDPSTIGISCTFNPETGTLSTDPTNPTQITVTVLTKASGSTTTRRQTRERILAALWLGMPGIVLIGSLRLRNLSRKRVLQILGTLLLLIVLMQGIGCGGGFTPPPSPVTPAGAYNLLVVGYSNGTPVTSAVVPVIVTH